MTTRIARRDLLTTAGATIALAAWPLGAAQGNADTRTNAMLDAIAEEYLAMAPEAATSLGIDTGARVALKSRTSDRSPAARARWTAWLRTSVGRLRSVDPTGLGPQTRIDVDVARTAYETALDGLAFPYGAVAIGGWRNGPYVVAQNMGAYLDTPKFLDANHKVATAADAEAYLSRLSSFAGNLDGETERLRGARGRGVVASDIPLDKTLAAIRMTRAGTPATADAGVWKLPDGADYYAWTLRAATTTRMTPDEVHARVWRNLPATRPNPIRSSASWATPAAPSVPA